MVSDFLLLLKPPNAALVFWSGNFPCTGINFHLNSKNYNGKEKKYQTNGKFKFQIVQMWLIEAPTRRHLTLPSCIDFQLYSHLSD